MNSPLTVISLEVAQPSVLNVGQKRSGRCLESGAIYVSQLMSSLCCEIQFEIYECGHGNYLEECHQSDNCVR